MFIERAIVTFILGPLALYLVYLGGLYYFIPITIILILATLEYEQLLKRVGWRTAWWLLLPANVLLYVAGNWSWPDLTALTFLLALLAMMLLALYEYEKRLSQTPVADWLGGVAGVLLLGWLGSHFFLVQQLPEDGWRWTMLALLVIWVADSAAYAYGKRFGRHKLAPRLSPNKTVEGYVAGILGGTSISVILASQLGLAPVMGLAVGAAISIIAPAGDLAISLLKREAKVKDSGHLLPGHGGALDRIDSLVWSVALTYYIVLYLG